MDNAERQLSNAPDSALNTMRSIRKIAIVLPERRARYGLLYSMALDKNYIDIAADSLIRFSTQYYDHKGSPEQRMRAYYYLGRTQENAGDNLAATMSFLDAAQYLDQVDDNYLKGLLCSKLGQMYYTSYNYKKAYEYAVKSYNFYKNIDLQQHQIFQLYEIGYILYCLNKYDQSINQLKAAITQSRDNYTKLTPLLYRQLAIVYNAKEDYNNSYKTFKLCQEQFSNHNIFNNVDVCGAAADTYSQNGEFKKAEQFLSLGMELAQNERDSVLIKYYKARCLFHRNHTEEGHITYHQALFSNIQILNQIISKDISEDISNYFNQKLAAEQGRTNKRKNTYIIILLVGITLSVFIVLQRLNRTRQLQKEIEKDLAIIDDIRKDYQRIGDRLLKQTKSQFEIFDQLCLTFYQYSTDEKKQKYVYKELQTLIKNFSKDTIIIEKNLNEAHDNIIAKLRAELPELTENDIRLACYILSGFSNQTIAVFLSCEYSAATTRRSRLKSKILNAHTPNNELFKIIFK